MSLFLKKEGAEMDAPGTTQASTRYFLHILFKRKIHIPLFFGATVGTMAIGTLAAKPTYVAMSQILIKVGRENIYVLTVPDVSLKFPTKTMPQDTHNFRASGR